MTDLFPGFASHWIDTPSGRIFARSAGDGPPVVLVHGFPQTHVCWHRIASELAKTHQVVAMDLRGYGWSSVPREDYSKRAMGADVVEVMSELGHATFAFVGHDRGARVGYRLALDHPGRLTRLALLDIMPTMHVWRQIEAGTFPGAHWEFLSRPAPEPETEIGRDPVPYFEGLMAKWTGKGTLEPFDPRALSAYRAGFNETSRIHAFCEDYRAGAGVDRAQDEADHAAGRTIACPVGAFWGRFYLTGAGDSPLDVWRATFAPDAVGAEIPNSGHFVAEENPAATLEALQGFLAP